LRGWLRAIPCFLLGAIGFSVFSTVAKLLFGYPLLIGGYLMPVLVGGGAGIALGLCRFKVSRHEEKLERLNRVLRTVRDVNELLFKEKDPSRLLHGICQCLVQNRGYFNVWIVLMDDAGKSVEASHAGPGEGFPVLERSLHNGMMTQCGRRALSSSGLVITEDPPGQCHECPLAGNYEGRGAMTIRLHYHGKIYGLLSVSIPRDLLADKQEQELFEEVADDISFGLYNMELEEEHRKSDAALRASEKRFRRLIENSLTGISIVQNNRVVYQNPESKRLLEPLQEPFKVYTFENVHPEDVEKVKTQYKSLLSGRRRALETDFRFYPPGKINRKTDMKWVYCRATRIEYKGREAILINMMDMTRAKELEQLLRTQDKMASLGHVAAGIAHEIRNPLSGINIYLNTLSRLYPRTDNEDQVSRILDQLQSASNKIESVIKRVMDFSRPTTPRFIPTDINEPIQEALNLCSVTLRKSAVEIETALGQDLPKCQGDPQLLEEVVLNLITNAAEALKESDKEKKIRISSSAEGRSVVVRIADSGPGVALNIREKVFDPFYTTNTESTGIGLSLSQKIIADHGGSLDIATSQWGGAEFVIELPLKPKAEAQS